jgi:hypothetical protein
MDRGVNGHGRLDAFSSDEEPVRVQERRIEYEVDEGVGREFLSDSEVDDEEDARVIAEIENRRAAAPARPPAVRRVRARGARQEVVFVVDAEEVVML